MSMSNRIFRGAVVSIKEHDIEDDTFMLINNITEKIMCIGKRESIIKKYDEIERDYYCTIHDITEDRYDIEDELTEEDKIEEFLATYKF